MDPAAITFFDEGEYEEEREITIGHSVRHRLLVVVHTERKGDVVREEQASSLSCGRLSECQHAVK
jgi:uncharacterized DUF497 family protein